MLHENFIILALLLGGLGGLIYLRDTLSGNVKPNRVTYFLWALLPLIAFVAEIDEGVGLVSYFTLLNGLFPAMIFIASFLLKDAYWKLEKFDYFMGGLALMGLIFWQITGDGVTAIIFAIIADAFAGFPTIRKAFKKPETENVVSYALLATGALISILTIDTWDFAHYGFPIYFLLLYTSISVAVIIGNKRE